MKDFDYYFDLFQDMLDLYEFDLLVDKDNYWRVEDRQGANLGDIENDRFDTIDEIVDRMDIYHYDYIVRIFDEDFSFADYSSWEDLYKQLVEMSNKGDLSEWEYEIKLFDVIVNGSEPLSNKEKNDEMKKLWRDKHNFIKEEE